MYIEDFLNFQRNVRNLSEGTIKTYSDTMRLFKEFMLFRGVKNIEDIKKQDVYDYIFFDKERGCAPSTCNCRLFTLRTYFDYLVRFHELKFNYALEIKPMKQSKVLPTYIKEEQIIKCLNSCNTETLKGARAHAILITLFHCGLRLNELKSLTTKDVDYQKMTLRVNGKGRKQRMVPMSYAVANSLQNWFNFRVANSSEIFTSNKGEVLTDAQIYYIVKKYLKPFVEKKLAHPHALRHSFATILLNKGVPLPSICKMMGHASISTTLIYMGVAQQIENPFNTL